MDLDCDTSSILSTDAWMRYFLGEDEQTNGLAHESGFSPHGINSAFNASEGSWEEDMWEASRWNERRDSCGRSKAQLMNSIGRSEPPRLYHCPCAACLERGLRGRLYIGRENASSKSDDGISTHEAGSLPTYQADTHSSAMHLLALRPNFRCSKGDLSLRQGVFLRCTSACQQGIYRQTAVSLSATSDGGGTTSAPTSARHTRVVVSAPNERGRTHQDLQDALAQATQISRGCSATAAVLLDSATYNRLGSNLSLPGSPRRLQKRLPPLLIPSSAVVAPHPPDIFSGNAAAERM
ncbi:hypothetical protein CEUSTIGMA_g2732.t1 [Chlamydomonas eustigma]|uniref:Uncharacterized protein n=1 Tax=Chlamydomonas eustigma TaxID=1157962 RepID=A0A250WWS0_9CHLO|nr:hypothetical protein CEUSTIGMA_g2732.t1 [Chlamydomonas eustigma]|eukprot:GAX75287.1 hypothetical protein CEUSTIGMA_g2732.t1 [Chlamydomonas eustigma]